jgi:hypothetical protein
MAANNSTLADEDGEFPDWIELHNVTSTNVSLANWSLTDDITARTKWRFPATNLTAGGYLVVFASGKDRAQAGPPLHTNFKLDAAGEYLALLEPDGTLATAYAPIYPSQASDVSYGLDPGFRQLPLLPNRAAGRFLVPTDGNLGTNWLASEFADASWPAVTLPIGFTSASIATLPRAGLTNALVGYWKFDETNGITATDSSGFGNHGGLLGFPTSPSLWSQGRVDGALRFRGSPSTDLVRVANYPKASNALSAAAWVWADGRPVWASIAKNWASVQGQFHFGFRDTGGDLDIFIHTSTGDFSARENVPFPLGSWQHVAFTAGQGVLRLYRNGVLVSSTPYTGSFVAPPLNALGIGVKLNSAGTAGDPSTPGYWQGSIDELAIWNRELAADELQALVAAGNESFGPLISSNLRPALFGSNTACYLRLPFSVEDPARVSRWLLRVRYDDGFVAWLNGTEIVRQNAPDPLAWNSSALAPRATGEATATETFNLANFSELFVPGTNLLAIQALNAGLTDPDLLLDATLEGSSSVDTTNALVYFTTPTPGAPNQVGIAVLGPIIKELRHQPTLPGEQEAITVTARVAPTFAPLTNVSLRYRVMYSNEVTLPMLDDGAHGDGLAGDGIYGATIPASASGPGQMVRYAVAAADTQGRASREPLFADPLGSPEYQGTIIQPLNVTSTIPVMHWFVATPSAAETDAGTRASFFTYNGEFHDNVFIRIRGGTARGWPKKSYKVEMNDGEHFLIHPGLRRVSEFDLNATYTDKSYVRAVLTAEFQLAAAVPAPETFHVHLRQNGAFYSVALFVEQPDRDFLRRHDLDENGALYKCGPGSTFETVAAFEKKTRPTEDKSDAQALLNGLTLTGPALETFVFDHLDIPALINFLATVTVSQNIDASDKNLFLYRDTAGTGEWRLLPWDLDLTFGPDALNTDTIVTSLQNTNTPACASHPFLGARPYLLHAGKYSRLIEALVNTPRTRMMLLRRVRTLTDQFLATSYFPDRIEALVSLLSADAAADNARWGANSHFPGATYTMRQAVDRLKNEYLLPRLPYLTGTNIGGVGLANPRIQPLNARVTFGDLEVNPASGNQAEEYFTLTNPAPFPIDLSGWRVTGGIEHTIKPGTILLPNEVLYLSPNVAAFRSRGVAPKGGQRLYVQGDYRGQLSARGESLRLLDTFGIEAGTTSFPGSPSLPQQFLRITEIMYRPPGGASGEELEFIELRNISSTISLDLTGVHFGAGIEFAFAPGPLSMLAPGGAVVIVRNQAAFVARYGGTPVIAGQFTGALENGGERLLLLDARGEEILDFHYQNSWHPVTDGLGFSLVIVDEQGTPESWNDPNQWRASVRVDGSPALPEPPPSVRPAILITEVLTRTDHPPPADSIELFNPEAAPADLNGWFLSDDFNSPKKFRLPSGTVLASGGFRVFTEADFNPSPGLPPSFALRSTGDEVWLFSADTNGTLTGYVHGLRFGAAEDGVSFGRLVTSEGLEHIAAQTQRTLGAANAGPRVGPVIFTELMYHPPETGTNDNTDDEFIEIRNTSNVAQPLFDPAAPTNSWRMDGGVQFQFPPALTLAPGEFIVLVHFAPSTNASALNGFRNRYGIAPTVRVLGAYNGKLNNDTDEVILLRPLLTDGTNRADVVVESLRYRDEPPWPAGADGFGLSLQRNVERGYAGEPAHWSAAPPTAGASTATGAPPVIVSQPQSQTAVAFGAALLQVTAQGTGPLRYQWRFAGANVSGATNATLPFANVLPGQAGAYQVVVYNSAGSTVSSNAVLSLLIPPTILDAPQPVALRGSTNVADYGSTTNRAGVFSVSAYSPSPLSYQWRFNGAPIPDATGPTLVVPGVTLANDGSYDVVVGDAVGSRVSSPARLTVLLSPLVVVPPTDQVVVQGGTFTASVVLRGNPPPFGYIWRQGSLGLVTNVTTSGVDFFTRTNLQLNQGGLYRLVITNAAAPSGNINSPFNVLVQADSDGDGLPDAWETNYFGNLNAGRLSDSDGDGQLDWQEFVAGTDPLDPSSALRLEPLTASDAPLLLFSAMSNHTYSLQYKEPTGLTPWQTLLDLPAQKSNGPVAIPDLQPNSTARVYRVVTPRSR